MPRPTEQGATEPRQPLRLLLVIHALTAGGAERVLTVLAGAWAARGDEVTVATFTNEGDAPFFALDPRVSHVHLGENGAPGPWLRPLGKIGRNLARMRAIRRVVRETRPDVIVPFMNITSVLTIVANRGSGIPIIAAEHVDPRHQDIGALWTTLRRWTYPHLHRLLVLNRSILESFPPEVRRIAVVMPNPVVVPEGTAPRAGPSGHGGGKSMLAMGRMSREKGFDLLLDAFARLAPRHPDWSLEIRGEGDLRPALEAKARALGVHERVRMPGTTGNVAGAFAAADVFVLSSRSDAFPMALCEAMASGVPVVSFDCPSGPREIVHDGVDGLLVPPGDVVALATAIERVIEDETLARGLSARGKEIVVRFGLPAILERWDALFAELPSAPSRSR